MRVRPGLPPWAKISRAVGAWSLLGDKNHLPQAKHSRERVTKFFERKSRKFKRKISRIIFGVAQELRKLKKILSLLTPSANACVPVNLVLRERVLIKNRSRASCGEVKNIAFVSFKKFPLFFLVKKVQNNRNKSNRK